MTPLQTAVEEGNQEICLVLLRHGADINQLNIYGETALHYAVRIDNIAIAEKMAELLIDNGADRSAINRQGRTPLEEVLYWSRGANRPLIELLSKKP